MQFAQQKKSWRKSLVPPPAVALPPTVVQRQKCCWRNAVRDENKIFVTRSWRQFCGAVSDRTARFYSLDENRHCCRYGGQRGGGSALSFGNWTAAFLVQFFLSCLHMTGDERFGFENNSLFCLVRDTASAFAGICALSYRYDRPIHRTSQFRMSVCSLCRTPLSYRKHPAHAHFDMIILTDL